jgi:type IV secretion system protein VirB8
MSEQEAATATHYAEALDWDASRVEQLERSERRAWTVAIGAGVALLLSWLALALLVPLKEAVPYVLRVDATTGVPDLVTTLKDSRVGYDEVLDKYWVASYVRGRETYDWYTLQRDYEAVTLLSAPPVAAEYAKQFDGPEARDRKLGNAVRATVTILSIVPTGHGIATVRFSKRAQRLSGGEAGSEEVSRWVATIAYEYRNPSKLRESLRLTNPFGFQALSYRVDPELLPDAAVTTAGARP